MIRISTVFILTLLFMGARAQEIKLLRMEEINTVEGTPIYERLVDESNNLKPEYRYLDSITMNRITYKSDGLKVTGLIVMPGTPGTYPCIIFNRGGNRDFGQLTVGHAVMLGKYASQGYVIIASNYRGNGGSEGHEEFGGKDVNDVLNLIDVLAEIDGADTGRIGMFGWSRGGMMTYLALTQTNRIKAAAVGGAMSDLTIIDRPEMETGVYAELIPDYETNKEDELKKRSAIYWADKFSTEVPILMLHGNSDWRVQCSNSLRLAQEFDKYRVPYRLIIYEGGDHGINEFKSQVTMEVIAWFDRYLKGDGPLPDMEYHGR